MQKKKLSQSGITLIALIITIIVMLILVAVTVKVAIDSGLFGHAKKATDDWKAAEEQEKSIGSDNYINDTVNHYTNENSNVEYTVPIGLKATYGDLLSSVVLPDGFTFENIEDNTTVGNAGRNKFTVSYTSADNKTARGIEVEIEVEKAVPEYTVPEKFEITYGTVLSEIELPEGFSIENSTGLSTNVGTYTLTLTYTPNDTNNYKIVNGIEVLLFINRPSVTL